MGTQDIITTTYETGPKERMRTENAVRARYEQALAQYHQLMQSRVDPREQRVMLYAEIKALGWVLGKAERTIAVDVAKQ